MKFAILALSLLASALAAWGQPAITQHPTNISTFSAGYPRFSVTATGEPPLRYQWFFNKVPLPARTLRTLTVLNAQGSNAGDYFVVVSNTLGAVTSRIATLSILIPTNGQNVRIGDDAPQLLTAGERGQAEPHIVRSFVDPNLIVATFQEGRHTDGGSLNCGYAISHDGGVTWSHDFIPSLTTLVGGPYDRASDPVAGIGPDGTIYLSTLAFDSGERAAFCLSLSTNDGVSFGKPIIILTNQTSLGPVIDKQWLAVNSFAGSPHAGRLLLSWTYFTLTNDIEKGGWLGVKYSDDKGRSWSPTRFLGPTDVQGTQPLYLPDGSLALIYYSFTGNQIEIITSSDGGETFESPRTITRSLDYRDPLARSYGFLPSATTDRMAGVIYLSWHSREGSVATGAPAILFSKSIDQGKTWSAPMRVNDTPNRRSVYDAAIAASPDGQHLTVIFYDKRNDPGQGYFVDLYLAESFDGGQTWQPNQRITESSSDLRKAPLTADGYMLGDYQGVAPALDFQTPAVACWIDTRSGNPDCYIRRLDRKRGTTFGAWQHLRFTTKELADDTVSGPNADLDGDGIPNLGEYIHGLEPRHADPNPSRVKQTFCSDPTKGPDCPAALQVAFESLSVLEDITFSWSRSENLVSWEQVSPAIEQVIPSPSRTFVTREASFLVNPAQPLEAFQLRKQQK